MNERNRTNAVVQVISGILCLAILLGLAYVTSVVDNLGNQPAAEKPPTPTVIDDALQIARMHKAGASELYPLTPISKIAGAHWVRPRAAIIGVVKEVRKEEDGDYHIRVDEDHTNISDFIVCEIIPELPGVEHPKVGDWVKAWGVVRFDGEHKWWELHPVVHIESVKGKD